MSSKPVGETRKRRRPAHLPGQRAPIACIPCSTGELSQSLTLAVLALVARVSSWSSVADSWKYYNSARELLQNLSDDVSLQRIQTYLVLCVYEVGCGLESRAWIHLGNAIRMAQILRLPVMDKPPSPFDWGKPEQTGDEDLLARELKRRTFWSCFFLDRLLSNGRDRPNGIQEQDICCDLPVSEEDLVFRRIGQSLSLNDPDLWQKGKHNLYVLLIRILIIFGDITAWHGRGGRHADKREPWKSGMPFTVLDEKLAEWERQIPTHLRYSLGAFTAVSMVSISQSKLWGLSYLFFFLAKASLHREYYPFVPQKGYNPCEGQFDPSSTPDDWRSPPPGWRKESIRQLLKSSYSITELYGWMMTKLSPFPGVYPFMGLCLMTSTVVNLFYLSLDETGFDKVGFHQRIESSLEEGIKAMENLRQFWDLPTYWINRLSLYRALLEKSKTVDQPISKEGSRRLTDGIMNYLRETRHSMENQHGRLLHVESSEPTENCAQPSSADLNAVVSTSTGHYNTPSEESPQDHDVAGLLNSPIVDGRQPLLVVWRAIGKSAVPNLRGKPQGYAAD
ncbi:hypothetical protein PENSUB_1469 [Penicillium subrubescens]|uniref:Xylanolytic transcriptional activator regulatory domain-containing protein n=1 Tax=Penicillium subrubescens TaxID=1316194 RepID=A0A1Q5UJT5_9EURO|nr:hypothetical protein PENSUB_1469 [Penicillium subrubescens]